MLGWGGAGADWPVGHLGNTLWARAEIVREMGRQGELKKGKEKKRRRKEKRGERAVEKSSCFHPKVISKSRNQTGISLFLFISGS